MNCNQSDTYKMPMAISVQEITSTSNTNIPEIYPQEITTKTSRNEIVMETDENSKRIDVHEIITAESSEQAVTSKSMWQNCGDSTDNDTSEGGLEIVMETPKKRKYTRSVVTLDAREREIVNSIENEMEDVLEEKATKAKLTTYNVKNILKHLVTNEHVLEMLEQVDDPGVNTAKIPIFEPKFTRAKTKYVHVYFVVLIFKNGSRLCKYCSLSVHNVHVTATGTC